MRIGDLDRRIVVQQASTTQDSYGQPIETWTAVATVWAQVTPMRGRETFGSEQVLDRGPQRFRIRYRSDVTVQHRLSYNDIIYQIHDVQEVGRHEGLDLIASLLSLGGQG